MKSIFSMQHNKMELIEIGKSPRATKRLVATFKNGNRIIKVHFGQQGSSTFLEHRDILKKENYIARHQVNEDWDNPIKAGTLARYILWNKPTLQSSIADFKARFGL